MTPSDLAVGSGATRTFVGANTRAAHDHWDVGGPTWVGAGGAAACARGVITANAAQTSATSVMSAYRPWRNEADVIAVMMI